MTPADIPRACELALEAGWRSREAFYRLVLSVPICRPLVGTLDGEIVATGTGTVSGAVGWVGTIVVSSDQRRRGFGKHMTQAVCDLLRSSGCRTLLLIATTSGEPLYERLGFKVQTHVHLLQAEGTPNAPEPPAGTRVRAVGEADLPALCALDAEATGENREPLLRALASDGGVVLEDAAGLRGFLLRSDRGYSPIVAPRHEDGVFLAAVHRRLARDRHPARAGLADENRAGRDALEASGWRETWLAPRMILGPDVDWHPEWIWGQINFAMG